MSESVLAACQKGLIVRRGWRGLRRESMICLYARWSTARMRMSDDRCRILVFRYLSDRGGISLHVTEGNLTWLKTKYVTISVNTEAELGSRASVIPDILSDTWRWCSTLSPWFTGKVLEDLSAHVFTVPWSHHGLVSSGYVSTRCVITREATVDNRRSSIRKSVHFTTGNIKEY